MSDNVDVMDDAEIGARVWILYTRTNREVNDASISDP